MLRLIEWGVQNEPIAKSEVYLLPATALPFWKFSFGLRTSYKKLIYVPATQMLIFILFVSAGVSFDGSFSQWVSLKFIF